MTNFVGLTAADIRAAVNADASLTANALPVLARRVLAEKPRRQSVDLFAELTGGARYVSAMDPAAYKAWIASQQANARVILGAAAPAAKAPSKPTKSAAKGKASSKRTPSKADAKPIDPKVAEAVRDALAKIDPAAFVKFLGL